MINKFTKLKIFSIFLIFVVCIYGICLRLYKYQITEHEEIVESSLRKTMVTYTQTASRGNIYDRNGVPLVSNEMSFQVVFDYYFWEKDRQNEIILQLCAIMAQTEHPFIDTLPITPNAPYAFTNANADNKYYGQLMDFVSEQKDWGENLNAHEIMEKFIEKYDISDSYTKTEQRIIAGVRYDMERKGFSSYSPYVFAEDVPIETVSKISEASMFFPGVTINEVETRAYRTVHAAHILGRIGSIWKEEWDDYKEKGYSMNDIVGKDGAEKAFEEYLRPIDGTFGLETDIDGFSSGITTLDDPQPGKDVYLTIDIGMQAVAEKALVDVTEQIKEKSKFNKNGAGHDAAGGACVVIDIDSGEILALASSPTYNLATFNADYNKLYEDPLTPMVNRTIAGLYPPGSIFKMVSALASLEEGIVTPYTKIRDEGVYRYYAPSYTPACWVWNDYGRTHGNINVSEAIKYSCNYFFYETSRIMGIDTLNSYAKKLGLGQKTGIELSGELKGRLAGPENRSEDNPWQPGETIQAAIGQSEHQFTPVQLASYIASLINGGTRYQTHLLKSVKSYDGKETYVDDNISVIDTVEISEESLEAIKRGMLGATTDDGTASSVFADYPIKVGGKTGSAQTKRGSSAHGTFLSFAPYDDPEIAVCVIIEHAGSGGSVAPVVREVYDYYFGLE